MLINTAGTTEGTKIAKDIENVELGPTKTQSVPMDLSVMGKSRSKHSTEPVMVWNLWTHDKSEMVLRKPMHAPTKQVGGLARTTRAKASLERTKRRANTTPRQGRQDVTKWRSTTKRKTHKPVNITQK